MDKLLASLFFGILASFFFTLSNLFDKKGSHMDPLFYGFFKVLFNAINVGILMLIVLFLFNQNLNFMESLTFLKTHPILVTLALLLFGVTFWAFLELIKSNHLAKILALQTLLLNLANVILGIIIFKDPLNAFIFSGLLVMLIGISLFNNLNFNIIKMLNKRDWILLLILVIGWSYYNVFEALLSKVSSSWVAVFWGEILTLPSFIFVFWYYKKVGRKIKVEKFSIKTFAFIALASLMIVSALVSSFAGTVRGYYSVTLVVSYLSIVWTALLASALFKEKLNKIQYLGILVIVLGLIILNIPKLKEVFNF